MVLNKTERPSLWKTITTEAFSREKINQKQLHVEFSLDFSIDEIQPWASQLVLSLSLSLSWIEFNLGQLGWIVPVLALWHPRVRQTSIQADLVRCHHVHPVAGGDGDDRDDGGGGGGGGDHHHHGHLPVNGLLHLSCMVRVGVVSLSPHACTIIFAINITSSSFSSTLSSLSLIIDDPNVQIDHAWAL